MDQKIILAGNNFEELTVYLQDTGIKRLLLVCDDSIENMNICSYLKSLQEEKKVSVVRFSDFQPNPVHESVESGTVVFRESRCDAIMAVGGGSAMDVAKCIKLNVDKQLPLIAMPTTAGTGSEATRFAVVYRNGEKQSISDVCCIPDAVVFDSSVLRTLPEYHKKATMLDALCHSIESMWSVNATPESRVYSRQAIGEILRYEQKYLENDNEAGQHMLMAANTAGKAINITQTTAGHAMCYKLTSLYRIAHGHAASLCVRSVWSYMLQLQDLPEPVQQALDQIAEAMGCEGPGAAWERYCELLDGLGMPGISEPTEEEMETLCTSANPVRLANHPVTLDEQAIRSIYNDIFKGGSAVR